MAQSSNYKQFERTTRVLTEETGFAGGMLWTNNNIDNTHLKAIVNCDYDETTGFLKSKDPFKTYDEAIETWCAQQETPIDLTDKSLIGVYNICAYDSSNDKNTDAGVLYIFAKVMKQANTWITSDLVNGEALILFVDAGGMVHQCEIGPVNRDEPLTINIVNSSVRQLLTLYDNQLYGFGTDENNPESFIQVFYLIYTAGENEEDEDIYCFDVRDYNTYVKPRIDSTTLLEASVTGFNAARGSDTFIYGSDSDGRNSILGIYLTDPADNSVMVSPRIGQECTLNIPISYNVARYYALGLFQLKETNTDSTVAGDVWQFVEGIDQIDTTTEAISCTFNFTCQKKDTTIAVVLYDVTSTSAHRKPGPWEVYSDDAIDILAPYTIVANNNLDNIKLKNYDLTVANNHCLWNGRMCLWGTEDNNNCLFLSEVENFYYYPIPNNVAVFDTNVISCIPYKDALLIFTADKIYRMTVDKDGSFVQTVVQNDMPMTKNDAAYLTAIKNMVLFKSGNYFYMVVPKTQSLTNELSIAPIYKNVAGLLNNLDKGMYEVLQLLYPEKQFISCIVVNNAPSDLYSEQDTIHILYDVQCTVKYKDTVISEDSDPVAKEQLITNVNSFKLFLNYNTNLRAWSMYIEETTNATLEPAILTLSRTMSFVRLDVLNSSISVVTQQASDDMVDSCRVLLDTGYRNLVSGVKKRFRELQIKLHSNSEKVVSFGTAFLVDGVFRRTYTKFEEILTKDDTVTLAPVYDINTFVTETSMPIQDDGTVDHTFGSNAIALSDWFLDFSHFKREAPTTIRIPVSGKGYNPRFIIMTNEASGLTINTINWIYRPMNGR